ncbi:FAD-dependent oxidoreductase [Legionella sp. CNM-4043-24]|uniref:FAD-dependent oxidoreductase n=1 Tax=Legionella sp. CNM-4043-24 TaxID=3421646 RepID=UPI00403AC930
MEHQDFLQTVEYAIQRWAADNAPPQDSDDGESDDLQGQLPEELYRRAFESATGDRSTFINEFVRLLNEQEGTSHPYNPLMDEDSDDEELLPVAPVHYQPILTPSMPEQADVVIVGGGPIGLAHAWALKKLNPNPDFSVVVLEKYQEYQRKHTLIMQPAQLERLMKATETEQDPALCQLLADLRQDKHIRTNELETRFKNLARDSGVTLVHQEVGFGLVRLTQPLPFERMNTLFRQHDGCFLYQNDLFYFDYSQQSVRPIDEVDEDDYRAIHDFISQLDEENRVTPASGSQFAQIEAITGVNPVAEQLLRLKPKMIIGADGTHSVISDALFPAGNQIKHPFDYVLQLRFEIEGDTRAAEMETIDFYQQMARRGIIANEYVGRYDESKRTTPVTMQMMISPEAFEALRSATSKNPLLPFAPVSKDGMTLDQVPTEFRDFINRYVSEKIKAGRVAGMRLDRNSIRISVNEAPATNAAHVSGKYRDVPVLLAGDAGLGLSYFKGLNAGLESTARLFTHLAQAVKASLQPEQTIDGLKEYQTWFAGFAERKVKEVESYSTWRIRAAMKAVKVVRAFKNSSMVEEDDDIKPVLDDYFNLMDGVSPGETRAFRLYPHRSYDPVNLGQFQHVPIEHSLKKTGKMFADYVKPYKTFRQFRQDLAQPLVGIVNVSIGIVKIVAGVFGLNGRRLGDGIFTLLRGTLELVTAPLSMLVKPLTRSLVSLVAGRPLIEHGLGMRQLAELGEQKLNEHELDDEFSPLEVYEVKAVCNDLHRKFLKADKRGQPTRLKAEEEHLWRQMGSEGPYVSRESVGRYFSLFRPAPAVGVEPAQADPVSQMLP